MHDSLPLPSGFVAHAGATGVWSASHPDAEPTDAAPLGRAERAGRAGPRHDLAILRSLGPCTSAGVFTRSRFSGPSVELSRPRAAAGTARAIVVVAGNANVATGDAGRRDAAELSDLAAAAAGVPPNEQLVASTGVIGRPYPMPLLRAHLEALRPDAEQHWQADAVDVARAMMTTDTVAKVAGRQVGAARVVGMAKGVGMIEPDMATMLAWVLTDAQVAPDVLDRVWRRAVDDTFNCLSVDTDTSTSDTAVILANGAAGAVAEADLAVAVREVCLDLTLQLARDGEGATKLITVTVRAARDRDQARRVAKSVVNSPLVKTAVHGADPNWGRVAMAVGKCSDDTDIDQQRVVIRFGDLEAYPAVPGPDGLAALAEVMAADHVDIEVELGTGTAEATVYGCDLTDGYIRINADYTT
ncbi:MAG TPA: bifunctional glutamate N-acetyltransferase/amino-acid acetyltransferase ArgJ [Acidimicrobiales bacterium]|nr:bifunctional glutamate N-acetyltransferase/amino-acid acetyltransferase ArgJ [Acidimicrobiales bacterium]